MAELTAIRDIVKGIADRGWWFGTRVTECEKCRRKFVSYGGFICSKCV